MKLSDIFSALQGLENGSELNTFLKQVLADKDKTATALEGQLNLANNRLETAAKELGAKDENGLEEALANAKSIKKELDQTKKSLEQTNVESASLKDKISGLERKDLVGAFSLVVGADRDVILDLLPSEVVLRIDEVDENGKTRKKGVIVQGKNVVDFADYVDNDDKLSKYKASIFPQEQNPPQTPPKLPRGKSSDNPQGSPLSASFQQGKKDKLSKLREKIGNK